MSWSGVKFSYELGNPVLKGVSFCIRKGETAAFVGGSGGNLREILSVLLEKNPEIRVVVNTVALESLAEAVEAFRELGFQRTDVVQMNVAKSRKVGGYQMMMGQNPVYVLTGQGGSV